MFIGISLPEGVDPSFLAALPEDIRREVLQNQLGIRPPSRPSVSSSMSSSATAVAGGGPGVTEVSREFLAALPLAIQEEVRYTEQIGLKKPLNPNLQIPLTRLF